MAYIQTQFQNGTIQELHITSDGKVESVFYNGAEWVLNGQLATKDDIPSGLINKQVLYGTTKVTTDANGAGWIPFAPNFKDANITFIVGQTDSNMVDRETHTLAYNGAAIVLYKNGTAVANSHGWISWIAIGTPL